MNKEKIKDFFKRLLNFLIKTTNGMALGLFGSLIVGTIVKTFGTLIGVEFITNLGAGISSLMGVGIACGVAYTMGLPPLWMISCVVIGAFSTTVNSNPIMPYLVVIFTGKLGTLILRKKTPIDILIVPLLAILLGVGTAYAFKYPIIYIMGGIEKFIAFGTEQIPFVMGIIVSVVMGMALTAPISSVAIAVALSLGSISPLAAGAAVVGCSCQMVGFAIQSIYDNNAGKVISVGIGTSMLQFKNILKKPLVWLPTIIASAILGPIATCLVKVQCDTMGAGMGTCGLVGQLGTFNAMGNTVMTWVSIIGMEVLAPALLVFVIDFIFRKVGWIKKGDLII